MQGKSRSVSRTFLFYGLGNPGPRYEGTRHNVGFSCIDAVGRTVGVRLKKRPFRRLVVSSPFELSPGLLSTTVLAEPLTYMNRSGEALPFLARRFRISPESTCIFVDNMDLPAGEVRMKRRGGNAGHNGLRSISEYFGTDDYPRVYIGIGRPPTGESVIDHVLGRFSREDETLVSTAIDRIVSVVARNRFDTVDQLISGINEVRRGDPNAV